MKYGTQNKFEMFYCLYFFSSFSISTKNCSRHFKSNIFLLGVWNTFGLSAGLSVCSDVGSNAGSNVDSRFGFGVSSVSGIVSFIGNNLLLKPLRTFYYAPTSNLTLFRFFFFNCTSIYTF